MSDGGFSDACSWTFPTFLRFYLIVSPDNVGGKILLITNFIKQSIGLNFPKAGVQADCLTRDATPIDDKLRQFYFCQVLPATSLNRWLGLSFSVL